MIGVSRVLFVSAAVLILVSGCTADTKTQPVILVENVTVSPGENASIKVTAKNVGTLRGPGHPVNDTHPQFDLSNASLSPEPTGAAESYPPYWMWEPPAGKVEVSMPLRVPEGMSTGEYRYEVTAWSKWQRGGNIITRDILVTVEG